MSLNHRNNQNFNYFSPKFSYFDQIYTGRMFYDWFYWNFDKIHQNYTNYTHQKIEPIKARFSTNDRLGFTVPTYAVGEMVIIYYRQVLLTLGIAWLCERWYRILLIGCLHLSLGCDTWFTSSYATLIPWSVVMTTDPWCKWIQSSSTYCVIGLL